MSNNAKGLSITSFGVLIMSLESLFIKSTDISPIVFSFYLGIFVFFSMIGTFLIQEGKNVKVFKFNYFWILILCAILMGISNILFIVAIKTTTVANVVIIFGTSALFSALFSYLFYRQKVGKNIFYSSFFMFVGLFIIFNDQLGLGALQGNLFALICTIAFAISFVLLSKYKEINRVVLIAISGLVLSIISYFLAERIYIDFHNLLLVSIMGLLITPVSRVLISNGTKYINASEVSLLMIIETIMAPIWVWIFLNEIPTSYTLFGGTVIIITLVINSIYTLKYNKNS